MDAVELPPLLMDEGLRTECRLSDWALPEEPTPEGLRRTLDYVPLVRWTGKRVPGCVAGTHTLTVVFSDGPRAQLLDAAGEVVREWPAANVFQALVAAVNAELAEPSR